MSRPGPCCRTQSFLPSQIIDSPTRFIPVPKVSICVNGKQENLNSGKKRAQKWKDSCSRSVVILTASRAQSLSWRSSCYIRSKRVERIYIICWARMGTPCINSERLNEKQQIAKGRLGKWKSGKGEECLTLRSHLHLNKVSYKGYRFFRWRSILYALTAWHLDAAAKCWTQPDAHDKR
jgi:hypothetical protein